eukprot:gene12883-14868_t
MKVKKKVITDQCGSASQTRAIVREVLWGLVTKIHQEGEENAIESVFVHTTVPEPFADDSADLPVQFKSKNTRKRKGREDSQNNGAKKKQYTGLTCTLSVPKYNGTLLEENVYIITSRAQHAGMVVRIVGNGPTIPSGTTVVGRILGKCGETETDHSFAVLELSRAALATIPVEDRHEAHKLVQIDEQRILMENMPAGVHLKYWDQRYRLLSLFDQGIKLDAESWYSITPEAVAKHVTSSCIGRAREWKCRMEKVLDCFSGCGGNTIPFAALGKQVVSVDLDPVKVDYLRHNCGVYGVDPTRVETVCAEVYQLLSSLIEPTQLQEIKDKYNKILKEANEGENEEPDDIATSIGEETENASSTSSTEPAAGETSTSTNAAGLSSSSSENNNSSPTSIDADARALCTSPDLIILSPPWGGPDYLSAKIYDLYTMLTSGCGLYLTMLAAAVAPNLLLLLPVNTSTEQIQYIAEVVQMPYVVEIVSINNAPKVMAVYMGNFVAKKQPSTTSSNVAAIQITSGNSNHVHFASD